MALLRPQEQPQPGAMPPGQAPQQPPQPGAQPAEAQGPSQEMYDRVMSMLLQFVYSEQGVQAVSEGLKLPGEPEQNIATVVARLIQRLWLSAKEQGAQLPPMIVLQATIELTQAITDMAIAAGIVEESQANEAAKAAFYEAMAMVGQQTPKNQFAPGEREQFQGFLQKISQRDEQHRGGEQGPAPEQEGMA